MSEGIFTFYPQFKEFLPLYRDVTRVWIGDGENTGEKGMLYAEYANGQVAELGFITLYPLAVEGGYTGTEAEWMDAIIHLAASNKGATVVTTYQNSDNPSTPPLDSDNWSPTPSPQQGKYLWARSTLTWADQTQSNIYNVSYIGQDSSLVSVNGLTGEVVLHGENIKISSESNETIKSYVDSITFEPEIATDADIDALFGIS